MGPTASACLCLYPSAGRKIWLDEHLGGLVVVEPEEAGSAEHLLRHLLVIPSLHNEAHIEHHLCKLALEVVEPLLGEVAEPVIQSPEKSVSECTHPTPHDPVTSTRLEPTDLWTRMSISQ